MVNVYPLPRTHWKKVRYKCGVAYFVFESKVRFWQSWLLFLSVQEFLDYPDLELCCIFLSEHFSFFPPPSVPVSRWIPRMHPVFRLTPNAVIRLVQNVYKDQYGKFGMLHFGHMIWLVKRKEDHGAVFYEFGILTLDKFAGGGWIIVQETEDYYYDCW